LLKEEREKDVVCFKCIQPGHRASECKIDGKVKQDQNTNVVQDRKEELKLLSIFTPSGLELKTVQYKSMMFQGLVNTCADLCLIRRSVYTKLGRNKLTGLAKCLTGIGDSQVLTFGSFVISVEVDGIDMQVEFHGVPDEDMGFDSIVGRKIVNSMDMKVTKGGTEFISRVVNPKKVESQRIQPLGKGSCAELFVEFKSMCMLGAEQADIFNEVDMSSVQKEKALSLIGDYKPIRNCSTPVKVKILLTDDLPVIQQPRRLAECEQKIVDDQVQEWLCDKIIKPSVSEYASPVVLVSKKNGKKRLCCDYRKLN